MQNSDLMKRLLDFITLIMLRQCPVNQVVPLSHQNFFISKEQDTAVYVYGPYEQMDHHQGEVLVIKFINDSGLKIHATWQGVAVTVESNLPGMGWDHEDGEFGLGGDWWKQK